jgi:hypothetical protein
MMKEKEIIDCFSIVHHHKTIPILSRFHFSGGRLEFSEALLAKYVFSYSKCTRTLIYVFFHNRTTFFLLLLIQYEKRLRKKKNKYKLNRNPSQYFTLPRIKNEIF